MNYLEYYKHKENLNVIKYLKQYNLYNEGNFKSEEIKRLICLIIKNLRLTKLKRQEILESVLKELFENYRYDRDYEGETPLHKAYIQYRYCKKYIIDKLLKRGANINAKDNEGETPLIIACKYGNEKVVKVLVDYGADINKQDNEGYTPIFIACRFSRTGINIIDYLVSKKADLNIPNNESKTPIFELCLFKSEYIVNAFIENGVKINIINNNGDTPLKMGYLYNKYVINCLIDHSAKYYIE
ncbi:ankyrin [Anaeromyces robustus]|uniref:Ankyrin n=1 Tax=Anaeromyces robustus TaxID=1754192 RepID=A0A1Y1WY45_9FUNG|nr:ankyrin [Anaeromyces robustus]|eukprot:ORX78126.1 ankyrin [Anaeromyces robustus]